MKNILKIKNTIFVLLLSVLAVSCVEDDYDFGELSAPANLSVTTEVVGQSEENPFGDGSGEVIFNATADGALTYKYIFENGSAVTTPSGMHTQLFSETGTKVYTVTVIAYGPGGSASSMTTEVEVLVTYEPPQDLLDKLIGKEWRIKAEMDRHFGLGPVGGVIPSEWYGAPANDKEGSGMYDDRYIFNEDGTFTHITDVNSGDDTGTVFGRSGLIDEIGGCTDCEVQGADVLNIPYQDYTETWSISAPGGVETISLSGNGFIGYYIGGDHKYEIWDRSETNEIHLRSTDGNGEFDWWFVLTSEPIGGTSEPEEFESQFNTVLWEETFDSGSLDTNIWNIETGNGVDGWGNQEAQYYTADNVSVSDGNLVITAKAESLNGFDYTSARITTKGTKEFTYGRVEVRAQLPSGGGVWPAIWMLGADFDTAGWPETGEIDIMEYKGNEPDVIHGSLHFPGNSGGNAVTETTTVNNVESEFHLYSVEWTEDKIFFLVDNVVFHEFENSPDVPFNKDFFLILNVAMGGTFGGDIDAGFTESSMLVDYIRVYQ